MRKLRELFAKRGPDFTVQQFDNGVLIEAQNTAAAEWLNWHPVAVHGMGRDNSLLVYPAHVWHILMLLQDDGFTYQRV